jgi:hypothetical protein
LGARGYSRTRPLPEGAFAMQLTRWQATRSDRASTLLAVSNPANFYWPACRHRRTPDPFEVIVKSCSHSISGADKMSSGQRQRQLPSARPGVFIRASAPRLSTSCSGTTASAAPEDHANSINAGAASLPRPSRRFISRQRVCRWASGNSSYHSRAWDCREYRCILGYLMCTMDSCRTGHNHAQFSDLAGIIDFGADLADAHISGTREERIYPLGARHRLQKWSLRPRE